jgi:photosystem II stability/assembly factor-like uncharacterized protein
MFAQAWHWQNPLPQGNRLAEIQFVDSLHGWIRTDGGTVLRTTDGGNIWEEKLIGKIFTQKIFFVDRLNGWCIGSGCPPFLMRTRDGGSTWIELPAPIECLNGAYYNPWDVFFLDTLNGFFGHNLGAIYKTIDGGVSWQKQFQNIPPGKNIRDIYFINNIKGFAIGNLQLLKTTDGGDNWVKDSAVVGISDGKWHKINFIDSLFGWIITNDSIYRTTDNGTNWSKFIIDNSVNGDSGIRDINFISPAYGWASTGKGLFKSIDSGKIWTNINTNYIFSSICFLNINNGWATSNNILYNTTDGGITWIANHKNITEETLFDIDFIDDSTGWAVGTGGAFGSGQRGEIIYTKDGGNSWDKQNSGVNQWLKSVEFINKDVGWIAGTSGTILKTTNGGNIWLNMGLSTDFYLEETSFINSLEGWIVGWSWVNQIGVLLHTNNGGLSWTDQSAVTGRLFGVFFVDSLRGWIASGGGTILDVSEIYNTTNGGLYWNLQYSAPGNSFGKIIFLDSLTGWISSSKGLMKTKNGGVDWELIDVFSDQDYVSAFTFYEKNYGWVRGLQGNAAYTTNGGENWILELPQTSRTIWGIDFINERTGWCAGDFGTVFKTTTGGISSIKEIFKIETFTKNFDLYQNYPNPFNPTTTINYQIPVSGLVQLKVYDLLGREIAVLVNEVKSEGLYSVDFDAGNLPSGVYIYSLRVNDFAQNKKMTLLK